MNIEESKLLAQIAVTVNDMHDRLFGNGQPGELAELKARASALEKNQNMFLGALGVISAAVSGFFAAFIAHIFKTK